jgi:hypothetical protein
MVVCGARAGGGEKKTFAEKNSRPGQDTLSRSPRTVPQPILYAYRLSRRSPDMRSRVPCALNGLNGGFYSHALI